MPSVEMRRSTRVFVPPRAKDEELVKVLRSGRRLWVDSATEINRQTDKTSINDLNWIQLIENHSDFKSERLNHRVTQECRNEELKVDPMEVDGESGDQELEKRVESLGNVCRSEGRVIRNVYCRKRKRISKVCKTRRFGVYFVRRKRKCVANAIKMNSGGEINGYGGSDAVFSIVIESYCAGCSFVSRVLASLFKHLRIGGDGFAQILAFLVSSSPITNVFASFGIHFLLNLPRTENRGVCTIAGERLGVPLLVVDFSAIPLYFLGLHVALSLTSMHVSRLCWRDPHNENDSIDDDVEITAPTDGNSEKIPSFLIAPCRNGRGMKMVVSGLEAGKTGSRNGQFKSGVLTRSASRSGRRSLRNRRARNPLNFVLQKPNGLPGSSHSTFKKNGVQLSPRRSARKNSASEINMPKSTPCSTTIVRKPNLCSTINVPKPNSNSIGLNVDIDSKRCCSVNILVVETNKCYRIEGAEVVLDFSDSNEWVLAVRKDGKSTYHFRVQKEIRPSTVNRFTHAVVWAVENGWKLEFPDRKDWVVFKELNKACEERNVVLPSPVVKIIPVPGVSEVANFFDSTRSFERPKSYIRTTSDELSRILSRTAASYDMDPQDEQWLSKFNNELDKANVLSEETFELMIDAFEKSSYYSPVELNDKKTAVIVCPNLASPELSIHVYRYWVERRKQRCAPLLRVFELNEHKRLPLITKSVLRKKRSLKRTRTPHPSQQGRGKDDSHLEALDVEETSIEEQLPMLDIQEAKLSADKSVEVAILKRQRAQFLMENADLAVYRATMALRIADAATQGVDLQQAADHFLD